MNKHSLTRATCALLAAFSLLLAVQPAMAQSQKIATIDLKTAFDEYWRTKKADADLRERAAGFDTARKDMVEDYQKANEEYRMLMESANDQAVAAAERDKRKQDAEDKLLEIKEIEDSIKKFDQQTRANLGEQQRRMRERILKDIQEVINAKAKAGGFTLVIDTAAQTRNETPVILYSADINDFTDQVLSQLNQDAPEQYLGNSGAPE